MSIYFIADTHFCEDNIRRYEKRPFRSVVEMNEAIIRNWNRVVSENDEVYILGDFGAANNEQDVLKRLNGTKYLVKGNHDTKSNEYYRAVGFSEVYDMPILFKNFWILSHEPIYVNSNMPYANLFGHVHNNPIMKDYSGQHFCVSAERVEYTPALFEDIAKTVKEAAGNE